MGQRGTNKQKIWYEIEKKIKNSNDIDELNKFLFQKTRLFPFFTSIDEYRKFKEFFSNHKHESEKIKDYGDFQTPISLTDKICTKLKELGIKPSIIIEPTCGKGNFVISALKHFHTVSEVYAVDIQKKYSWLFRWNLLVNPKVSNSKASIHFFNKDFFQFNFKSLLSKIDSREILILGNPPWITNTALSQLNSKNLPQKLNIKKISGIAAITGKSNFDIAENMIIRLIQDFFSYNVTLAMLCKTSVIRNIIRDSEMLGLSLQNSNCFLIDTEKEFKASTSAGLFFVKLKKKDKNNQNNEFEKDRIFQKFKLSKYSEPSEFSEYEKRSKSCEELKCQISSFYSNDFQNSSCYTFGYKNHRFISNFENYNKYSYIDGKSHQIWRQGVKHDATKIFVLTRKNSSYYNGYQKECNIEQNPIFPLVKSSDIKKKYIQSVSKFVIITQKKIGENTLKIASLYPKLWKYLNSYKSKIESRKSRIYQNKPPFSIFGIGDYSFSPFKIAISGFYKNPIFALIPPYENKPVMLDDTCYFLSFSSISEAVIYWILLNSDKTKSFLHSIAFLDAKRPFTKEILMRIDLHALILSSNIDNIIQQINSLSFENFSINEEDLRKTYSKLLSQKI
ncbi:hypothetical protein [Candidatus Harpocratesius sp.]